MLDGSRHGGNKLARGRDTSGEMVLLGRDLWTAIVILLFSWVLFAALEQRPFQLQGAVIESLVERGRLYFVNGNMKESVFQNLDTNTPSFRYLFNIFPYGGVFHVNHAPGQFLLAGPWYSAIVKLGWRFETDEQFVWRFLVWTLTAPLGALGVMCVFILARKWDLPWSESVLTAAVLAVCSPWWAASGVLYHDTLAVALILIGSTLWQCRRSSDGIWAHIACCAAGLLLGYSIVTTYLVVPIALLICGFILVSRPLPREGLFFALGFLPTLAILPITNWIAFGSILATGYSAGGFDQNYPSPFDLANAWEKARFYLWHGDYGLLSLFPVFLLGAFGLLFWRPAPNPLKRLLLTLLGVHFLFIISMEHHGSVGWGMGRFFLPLYPILVFGLPAMWNLAGWKGSAGRALVFATMMVSAVYSAAGAWYGVAGIMEPAVPTLKEMLIIGNYELYRGLFLLALIAGAVGELVVQWLGAPGPQVARTGSIQLPQELSRPVKSRPAGTARRNRRRK